MKFFAVLSLLSLVGVSADHECTTAYAFDGSSDLDHCFGEANFLALTGSSGPNGNDPWGWWVEPNGDFTVYAGAGQCSRTKGHVVGSVAVNYDASTGACTADMTPGVDDDGDTVTIDQMHFECQCDSPCPHKNGFIDCSAIRTPGQYDVQGGADTTSLSVNIGPCASGNVYALVHFVACGHGLPPPPDGPNGGGDPHFATWDQKWFDFHGECDLVFVDAPDFKDGLGFAAHIRTKGRYEYSFIEAAAIKIGHETFEIGSYGSYFLNGVEGVGAGRLLGGIAGFPITQTKGDKKKTEFKIDLGASGAIYMSSYKDLVGIRFVGFETDEFETAVGLSGHYQTGEHLARDGKTVIEDDNEFGKEWIVGPNDPQVFVAPSDHPGECIMPSATAAARRLGGALVSLEEAERACARMGERKDMCVFDVMATQDLGVADMGAY